jgi:outer membrane protein OmpA-like peptidoglycan-associated protein
VAPIVSSDGKTIYFTRAKHPLNTGSPERQDIWVSRSDGTNWAKAQNLGNPINNAENNGVVAISPDDKTIYLMNVYRSDGTMAGGLSKTTRTAEGWSFPTECRIEDFYMLAERIGKTNIKAMNIEFALSPQQNVLVIAAKRKDTQGSRDLYVCFLKLDGTWSAPKNMGPLLNTAEEESAPFVAADNKTLYFTSLGHAGYGKGDIFMTRRLDDTWTNWTEPENLGKAINTNKWEGYLTIPANDDIAYMSALRGKSEDIFKFKVFDEIKPEPVAIISGSIYDTDTRKPIAAEVNITAIKDNKLSWKNNFQPEIGEFKIIVPTQKVYDFSATKEGYFPVNETIDLTKDKSFTNVKKTIYLIPIKEGKKILLPNVVFEQSEYKLLPSALPELDRLADMMTKNATVKILLEGHTDNQGDPQLNLKLSESRVNEVKNYLVSKGIAASRIEAKGWGEVKPISSNELEEYRKRNRRVEFTILSL